MRERQFKQDLQDRVASLEKAVAKLTVESLKSASKRSPSQMNKAELLKILGEANIKVDEDATLDELRDIVAEITR